MSSLKRFNFILHDAENILFNALLQITKGHEKTIKVFDSVKNAQCRKFPFHNWENVLLCVKFINEVVTCSHMRDQAMVAIMFKDLSFSPFYHLSKRDSANACHHMLSHVLEVPSAVADQIKRSILMAEPPKLRQKKLTELDKIVMDTSFIRLASSWDMFLEIAELVLRESGLPKTEWAFWVRANYFRKYFPMTLSRNPAPIYLSSYAHPYEAAARANMKAFVSSCKVKA